MNCLVNANFSCYTLNYLDELFMEKFIAGFN